MINTIFTVVIVTYNRISELKKTLGLYEEMIYCPEKLIIVNNASSDETESYLENWKMKESYFKKEVITTIENLGGAGGFSLGITSALNTDCDFIFLADDDAYPDRDVFLKLDEFYRNCDVKNEIVGMCTKNINSGNIDCMHRRRVRKNWIVFKEENIDRNEYLKSDFEVDEFSFVGAAIKRDIVKEIGVPLKKYFIYFDDSEYSLRLRKKGRIICVTDAIMNHNTKPSKKRWGYYYAVRNRLDMVKRHGSKMNYKYYVLLSYMKYCSLLAFFVKWKSWDFINMCKQAIEDSKKENFGISEKYPPGKEIR